MIHVLMMLKKKYIQEICLEGINYSMNERRSIQPKISIIVPAYNVEKYIRRCIDSILEQTYENFELLLVDDGSTDSTFDILNEYIEGKNKKLKKQYVRTGQTLYSTYIEVKEGVSETDWIAFPYGKAVKEGAPVKELEGSGFADQLY